MSQVLSEQEIRAALKETNHMARNSMYGAFWPTRACRAIESAILEKLAGRLKDSERYAWIREKNGQWQVQVAIMRKEGDDCRWVHAMEGLDAIIDAQKEI